MSATMTLKDVRERLAAKRKELAEILTGAKGADGELHLTREQVDDIRQRNTELNDLGEQAEQLKAVDEIRQSSRAWEEESERHEQKGQALVPNGDGRQRESREARKSIGQQFVESAQYKGWRQGGANQTAAIDMKATFDTGGAGVTNYDRQPGIVLVGTRRLTVADLLAPGTTGMPTIRYVQEVSFTNAATTVAEGATKPEASFDTVEVDAPVKKIAVTAKVTDELFADFPAMQSYVDNRMPLMVKLTEEDQLLNGDGTGANLKGILQTSGIQTQARGTDPAPDAFYKAMVKVMFTGFFDPDGVVINPTDWSGIRLLRTADGIYIYGPPSDPGVERLWGLAVAKTPAITAGTGLVGAFQLGAQFFLREGIRLESTNANEDDFKKNLIAIRAEERGALATYRPAAFCTVTGL